MMRKNAFSGMFSLDFEYPHTWFGLLSFTVTLCLATSSFGQTSHFLVLKNGQVVEGKVEQQPYQTTIIKASGSRMVFDASRIECLCTSADQAYWKKYAILPASDVSGHIQLFEWCLSHQLFREARNELNVLQVMDVSASRLNQFNKRLIARKKAPLRAAEKTMGSPHGVVKQVGYNAVLSGVERAQFLKSIEDATKNLPDETVVQFKRKIEPLIIRSCYTAKCHDSGAKAMPLTAINKSLPIPKRMSQRNLYSILKFTDFDAPLESAVLAAAATPHGGQDEASLKIGSPQLGTLGRWLIAISSSPRAYHQAPAKFFQTDLHVVSGDAADNKPIVPAKAPAVEAGTRKLPSFKTDRTTETTTSEPKKNDPFDPEVFNRRYVRNRSEGEGN